MYFLPKIQINEKLYLKNPEDSTLGKKIVYSSIQLIESGGFEEFTFKKLAKEIKTTEASIYRYFENKHRLLIYLSSWYWSWQEFRLTFQTNNIASASLKLKMVIMLLVDVEDKLLTSDFVDVKKLHQIVVSEGTKTYLTKHVTEDNKEQFFKPYKDLCKLVSEIILENNPKYKYSRSLASTIIEMAHFQDFFRKNLPSLTDFTYQTTPTEITRFFEELVIGSIKLK